MAPLGIRISAIEPGNFQSRTWANGLALMGEQFRRAWERSDSVYRAQVLQTLDYRSSPEVLNRTNEPKPTPVAEAVAHALFAQDPKPRYLVCSKEETDSLVEAVLTVLRQLNEQHPHSLSAPDLAGRLQKTLRWAVPRIPNDFPGPEARDKPLRAEASASAERRSPPRRVLRRPTRRSTTRDPRETRPAFGARLGDSGPRERTGPVVYRPEEGSRPRRPRSRGAP